MSNANGSSSQTGASAVGQTANLGRGTSMTGGAAKVFREFKWGLLTLFLLMVVVIGLVYDGGKKKKDEGKVASPTIDLNAPPEANVPPAANPSTTPSDFGTIRHEPPEMPPAAPPINPTNPWATPTTPDRPITLGPPTNPGPGLTIVTPPAPAAGERTYLVKAGDNLTRIANTLLPGKGNVKAILDANKDILPNANKLRAGMVLKVPAALPTVVPAAANTTKKPTGPAVPDARLGLPTPPEPAAQTEYVVQGGDTLERIARKVLKDGKRWRDLYEWNRDKLPDPSHLRAGQKLKIKQGPSAPTAPVPAPGAVRAENEGKKAGSVAELEPVESSAAPAAEVELVPITAAPTVENNDILNSEPVILSRPAVP